MAKALKELLLGIIPQEHQWKVTLFKNWDEIIGPMKDKVIIEKIEESVLVLGVAHPAWAQELFLLSPMLKQKINRYLQTERITRIRFKFLDLPGHRSDTLKKQTVYRAGDEQKNVILKVIALSESEKTMLERINNLDLRCSLEQFFQRCKIIKG